MSAKHKQAVCHAYRHLYREGLKVINYSKPARHILLRTLQSSFRRTSPENFDPQKIKNTLSFLRRAADIAGIEHKIVRNILMVRYWEQPGLRKDPKFMDQDVLHEVKGQFNETLRLLNESLGTCLK